MSILFAIIHYQGQYRKAYITDEFEKWGERFVEAVIEGYKVPKHVHFNAIKRYTWTQTANEAA